MTPRDSRGVVLYDNDRTHRSVREDAMNTIKRGLLTAALLAAAVAAAQAPPTTRLRGTIDKVDGNVLTLKAADGATVKLTLAADARIVAVVKASTADIKPGTFLGSAAMPQPDGTQKALE